MTLVRGGFRRYDEDRGVVLFTMTNAADEVTCAISSAAMDDLDGKTGIKPSQREEQFLESKQDDALRAQRTKELRKMMKGVNRFYRERGR